MLHGRQRTSCTSRRESLHSIWLVGSVGDANVSSQDERLCAARPGLALRTCRARNKFAVIDVEERDPTVILGSYNWTDSGAYDNDENTLIIHDRDLARAYHAEWQRLWDTVALERICNSYDVYLPMVLGKD